ncbi:probable N-acetyltransferase HLS1-like [Quercus suber]|uniref:N-acetyltransferase hls1-like n=1 Tax=Quercus suber TaxID=58331 RepID=A0AAW0LSR0_QUESU|nr:probable N-acetyltransferase HLS1-like [Quercus suber]POE81029.1 putative n-acetyltransferase hls1-like [Quercus suber]
MAYNKEKKILIREFNEDRDIEVVGKLERNCEIGSKKGVSIFTYMIGHDPLCRIRLYPLHVMLVAELLENGELVGVVRGCIRDMGTGFGEAQMKMGCILGLRVSPSHRRMGIGLKLVNSVEEWLLRNGAVYTFFATEKNNTASINLFTLKCNYINLSSLVIFAQPVCSPAQILSQDIKIEKLLIDQAISLYKKRLGDKEVYPTDIEAILKEKLSLGTWVCYFNKEGWINLHSKEKNEDITKTSSSWVVFSIWNTCEAYKLQIRKSHPLRSFHETLSHARERFSLCLKRPNSDTLPKSIGFLFLYGLLGEGEKLGELMKFVWSFASKVCQKVKDCKVIVTELGVTDPLIKHVPQETSMSRINDLWYAKKMMFQDDMVGVMLPKEPLGNVFVDPRDF